jgi:hypothetical protein
MKDLRRPPQVKTGNLTEWHSGTIVALLVRNQHRPHPIPLRHEEQGGELAVSNSFLINTSTHDCTLQHYIYAIGEGRRYQHLSLPVLSLLVMSADDLGINTASVVSLHQSVLRKTDLIIE